MQTLLISWTGNKNPKNPKNRFLPLEFCSLFRAISIDPMAPLARAAPFPRSPGAGSSSTAEAAPAGTCWNSSPSRCRLRLTRRVTSASPPVTWTPPIAANYGVPFVSKFRIEDYMQFGGYNYRAVLNNIHAQAGDLLNRRQYTSRRFSKSHEHGEVDDTGIY